MRLLSFLCLFFPLTLEAIDPLYQEFAEYALPDGALLVTRLPQGKRPEICIKFLFDDAALNRLTSSALRNASNQEEVEHVLFASYSKSARQYADQLKNYADSLGLPSGVYTYAAEGYYAHADIAGRIAYARVARAVFSPTERSTIVSLTELSYSPEYPLKKEEGVKVASTGVPPVLFAGRLSANLFPRFQKMTLFPTFRETDVDSFSGEGMFTGYFGAAASRETFDLAVEERLALLRLPSDDRSALVRDFSVKAVGSYTAAYARMRVAAPELVRAFLPFTTRHGLNVRVCFGIQGVPGGDSARLVSWVVVSSDRYACLFTGIGERDWVTVELDSHPFPSLPTVDGKYMALTIDAPEVPSGNNRFRALAGALGQGICIGTSQPLPEGLEERDMGGDSLSPLPLR